MSRDTYIPRLHTDVWGEVRPMCQDALSAIGGPTENVYARTVPQNRNPGYPYVLLDGDQDEAPTYQTLDKWGLGFDLEARCVAQTLKQGEQLAGEVAERVTSITDPPEPDGFNFRYVRPLPDVRPEALESERTDVFERLVRARLIYRTAN